MKFIFKKTLHCLKFNVFSLSILIFITCPFFANGQSWPNQTIKIIVPFPAGGGTDALARTISIELGKLLNQTVYVENKPGANGIIGAQFVALAPPDGNTVLLTIASFAISPAFSKKLPFDVDKDFAPVSLVAKYPYLLTTGSQSELKTFKQFYDFAKLHPGKLSYASSGNGSGPHLGMELINDRLGLQTIHVPYKGAAPANNDLLGGNVDIMLNNLLASSSLIKSKKLNVLAVTTAHRSAALPDVPTLIELGYPNMEVVGWYGIFLPEKTPKMIVNKLSESIKKVIQNPDILARLNQDGAIPIASTPNEFKEFFIADKARWIQLSKKIKLELD
jgi:tripartite-type tricarboxylate transporter receptor subunit TctC